ncbi:MAG: hypothetical protein IT464_12705 [Planctomycetes bacterium]|nr:hypothetical protein [Planctomycetota bacterium]
MTSVRYVPYRAGFEALLDPIFDRRLTAGLVARKRAAGTIQVTGGAATVKSEGELVTPALANLAPADDYFTIEDLTPETWGFWFAGGRIQCIAKDSFVEDTDYILFDLGATTHAFWFDVSGTDDEPAGSVAADASTRVDISAATDEASVAALLVASINGALIGITGDDSPGSGLIAVAADTPGGGITLAETVTDAGFTVSFSDTIPAGAAALDNQVAVDISTGTTATHMGDAIETAINTAFVGVLAATNTAGTLAIVVDVPAGEDGDAFVLTETVTDAGFTVTTFAGGVGPDTFEPTVGGTAIVENPVQWVTSHDATAAAIAAAINSYTSVSGYYATVATDTVTVRPVAAGTATPTLATTVTETATTTDVDFTGATDWTHVASGGSLTAGHYEFAMDRAQLAAGTPPVNRLVDWRVRTDQDFEYLNGQTGSTGETFDARPKDENEHIIPCRDCFLVAGKPPAVDGGTRLIGTFVLGATTVFDYSFWVS